MIKNKLTRLSFMLCLGACLLPGKAVSRPWEEDFIVPFAQRNLKEVVYAAIMPSFPEAFQFNNSHHNIYNLNKEFEYGFLSFASEPRKYKFKDGDLRQFFMKMNIILDPLISAADSYPMSQINFLEQNLKWSEGNSLEDRDKFLADPIAQKWLRKNAEFTKEVPRILAYANIQIKIAPERFLGNESFLKIPTLSKNAPRHNLDYINKYHLTMDWLLKSNSISTIVTDEQLKKLKNLDAEIHEGADGLYGKYDYLFRDVEKAIYTSGSSLQTMFAASVRKNEESEILKIFPPLKVLGYRLLESADVAGRCDPVLVRFSKESIQNNYRDWRKIRLKNDMPVEENSNDMRLLYTAYAYGCFSNRDTVQARQILESWATNHGDVGRTGAFTHCTLAHWYRLGIGGPKDYSASEKWAERARGQVRTNCEDWKMLPIDPADPWKEF